MEKWKRLAAVLLLAGAAFAPAALVGAARALDLPRIVIHLPRLQLELYENGGLVKRYPVAIGGPLTQTPIGQFAVLEKEINPMWIAPDGSKKVPTGPSNPLGYRWIGFYPLYGIHGTNAPWSIGAAVSNGCVRMREADVEELYDRTPLKTPVTIDYDRVRIWIDSDRIAKLRVYDDVYKRQRLTTAALRRRLDERAMGAFAGDGALEARLNGDGGRALALTPAFYIRYQDRPLPFWGATIDGVRYVPAWPMAVTQGADIVWDEAAGRIRNGARAADGVVKNDILYVTAKGLRSLFGLRADWHERDNSLSVYRYRVVYAGAAVTEDVILADGAPAVPAIALAKALRQKLTRGGDGELLTAKLKPLPTIESGGKEYIKIGDIKEYFGVYAFVNPATCDIEITG